MPRSGSKRGRGAGDTEPVPQADDKVHYRPLGLTYGEAAVRSIARGAAGRLAGHRAIAFHAVEMIQRSNGEVLRGIIPFGDLPQSDALARLQMQRDLGHWFNLSGNPLVMGIVANVMPDSFSDGGRNAEEATAIANGLAMAAEGAAILDIGGESTRPGSDAVPLEEELRRDPGHFCVGCARPLCVL